MYMYIYILISKPMYRKTIYSLTKCTHNDINFVKQMSVAKNNEADKNVKNFPRKSNILSHD